MQLFSFDGHEVRTITDDKGEPWFVASDVAKILGYRDAERMTRNIRGKHKGTQIVGTPGGNQNLSIISEPGLYAAIMKSRVEGAERFQGWVTEEVLPTIRKHGAYMTENTIEKALADPDFLIQLATKLKEEQAARKQAEAQAMLMSQRLQIVEGTNGIIPGTFWTLAYGTKGKNIFIRKLRQMGFLYKQSQRVTAAGEATNLLRNWNRPIPDTDRTAMTAVIIPGKEWEFFQYVAATPELNSGYEPIINTKEELEARIKELTES